MVQRECATFDSPVYAYVSKWGIWSWGGWKQGEYVWDTNLCFVSSVVDPVVVEKVNYNGEASAEYTIKTVHASMSSVETVYFTLQEIDGIELVLNDNSGKQVNGYWDAEQNKFMARSKYVNRCMYWDDNSDDSSQGRDTTEPSSPPSSDTEEGKEDRYTYTFPEYKPVPLAGDLSWGDEVLDIENWSGCYCLEYNDNEIKEVTGLRNEGEFNSLYDGNYLQTQQISSRLVESEAVELSSVARTFHNLTQTCPDLTRSCPNFNAIRSSLCPAGATSGSRASRELSVATWS
jgi:hypothetical protein